MVTFVLFKSGSGHFMHNFLILIYCDKYQMLFQTFNDNANKYSESFMNLKYTQISNLQPDLSFFFFLPVWPVRDQT